MSTTVSVMSVADITITVDLETWRCDDDDGETIEDDEYDDEDAL